MPRQSGPRFYNFGDELSRVAVSALSGRRVTWSSLSKAEVVAVGSVLNAVARAGATPSVFGSGLRTITGDVPQISAERAPLVRGAHTRAALGLPQTTNLGDPGLLAKELFGRPEARRRGRLLIPHFAVLQSKAGLEVLSAAKGAGWRIVLPNADPATIALEVATADFVLTSSLHALVFAHSYGVPVKLSDFSLPSGATEPPFKYVDYASALGMELRVWSAREAVDVKTATHVAHVGEDTETIAHALPNVLEGIHSAARSLWR